MQYCSRPAQTIGFSGDGEGVGGTTARGRPVSRAGRLAALLLASTCIVPVSSAFAGPLPENGNVTAGAGTISGDGTTVTVRQDTHTLAIDWQSFSIGAGNTVRFEQPSATAAALNRVTGDNPSEILGSLQANGRVFLTNPAGITFGATAEINVGGLVASTLNISNEDFLAGNYVFEGDSAAAIANSGRIQATGGGPVALVAARVVNTGEITANAGSVAIGAGRRVRLDLGGPVQLEVEEAAVDALIEQGGAIRADDGRVVMEARAAGDVAATVINHTGVTQARSMTRSASGAIYLMGDMQRGRIQVAGTLDASAPNGGDGGFIETSAAQVDIADTVQVTTAAPQGRTGTWLIDPTDIVIGAGGMMTGEALSTALATNNMIIETVAEGNEAGDIHINDPVSWSSSNSLTLTAHGSVLIAENVTASGSGQLFANALGGNIVFTAGGTYRFNGILTSEFDIELGQASQFIRNHAHATQPMRFVAGRDLIFDGNTFTTGGWSNFQGSTFASRNLLFAVNSSQVDRGGQFRELNQSQGTSINLVSQGGIVIATNFSGTFQSTGFGSAGSWHINDWPDRIPSRASNDPENGAGSLVFNFGSDQNYGTYVSADRKLDLTLRLDGGARLSREVFDGSIDLRFETPDHAPVFIDAWSGNHIIVDRILHNGTTHVRFGPHRTDGWFGQTRTIISRFGDIDLEILGRANNENIIGALGYNSLNVQAPNLTVRLGEGQTIRPSGQGVWGTTLSGAESLTVDMPFPTLSAGFSASSARGDVTLRMPVNATTINLSAPQGTISLSNTAQLTSRSGNIALTALRFLNLVGPDVLALSRSQDRWSMWLTETNLETTSTAHNFNGLAPDFWQYGRTAASIPLAENTGNAISFAAAVNATLETVRFFNNTATVSIPRQDIPNAVQLFPGDSFDWIHIDDLVLQHETADVVRNVAFVVDPAATPFAITRGGMPVFGYGFTVMSSIEPRPITVTAQATTKELGQPDPVFGFAIGGLGLAGGDQLFGSLAREAGERAGSYGIGLGSLGNPNYQISFNPAQLTIVRGAEGGSQQAQVAVSTVIRTVLSGDLLGAPSFAPPPPPGVAAAGAGPGTSPPGFSAPRVGSGGSPVFASQSGGLRLNYVASGGTGTAGSPTESAAADGTGEGQPEWARSWRGVDAATGAINLDVFGSGINIAP